MSILQLFPARIPIGQYYDPKTKQSFSVRASEEFLRALGDVFTRIGGSNGQSNTQLMDRLDDVERKLGTMRSMLDFASDGYNASTDFSSALNTAIADANTDGGGIVIIPNLGYDFLFGLKVTLLSGVYLVGVGTPTLKLANGANATMIEGQNYSALAPVGTSNGGISDFGLMNLIIDGNRSNQSPAAGNGHGIAFYGRDFLISDVRIRNAYRRGLDSQYTWATGSSGTSPYNGRVHNLLVDKTGEEGWYNRVSDLHADDLNIRENGLLADNTYDGVYLGKSVRGTNWNIWNAGPSSSVLTRRGLFIDTGSATLFGVHVEQARSVGIYVQGDGNMLSGVHAYNFPTNADACMVLKGDGNQIQARLYAGNALAITSLVGLRLGETADASITADRNFIDIMTSDLPGVALDVQRSGGSNRIRVLDYRASGAVVSGTFDATDFREIRSIGGSVAGYFGFGNDSLRIGSGSLPTNDAAFVHGTGSLANADYSYAHGSVVRADNSYGRATGKDARAIGWGARAHSNGQFSAQGDNQDMVLRWRISTTDASATNMFLDGSSLQALIPADSTWGVDIWICGRNAGAVKSYVAQHRYAIRRNSGTTVTVSALTTSTHKAEAGWTSTVVGDSATGAMVPQVTGENGVRWSASARIEQLTYA